MVLIPVTTTSPRGTMRDMPAPEDPRIARGQALKDALEARRPQGLTQNKLIALANLSAPTWTAAVNGVASIDSYEAFEREIAEWDANPHDRSGERRRNKPVSSKPDRIFTIEMNGVFGVDSVTFSTTGDDTDAVQQAAIDFYRKIRTTGSSDENLDSRQ